VAVGPFIHGNLSLGSIKYYNFIISNGAINTTIILSMTNRYYHINNCLFVQFSLRHVLTFLFTSSSVNTQINNISPYLFVLLSIIVVLTVQFGSTFKVHNGMHTLKTKVSCLAEQLLNSLK
jgi:hypothetical protein